MIFTSLASYGHLYPLLPLAVAARDAGHEVVFATAADFHPTLDKAGLEPAAAGISIQQAFREAFAGDPRARDEVSEEELNPIIGRAFGRTMPERFMRDLAPLIDQRRPDLVVYELANPGGLFAAHAAGVPAMCHGFGRVTVGGEAGAVIREPVAAFGAELGIAGDADFAWGRPFVDMCPPSVQDPEFLAGARRVPVRPVGWSEPGDLPPGVAGRDRGRPLVYLTLGTTPMSQAHLLSSAVQGLATLEADVLVATGPSVDVAALGEVPPNVRLAAWVPQSELLPHVDLVVHHGGSGTTMGAFAAGVPQLVLPQGADQFSNAEAVTAVGAGNQLLGDEVTTEAVRDHALRLLTDTAVRDVVRKLADEAAAMPSPADVAATLPQYA
ncbi:UDP:flavonoid glycosyltransferase YjiC (YdhE family) [Amycolatopsis jiangsuensis]|uniref:UDP:flavonoid glycosyltransferase YjiC (YdhE family) n=2 Tax=Amycolatopsis jiangsuensis TaxID=1181879 RepID=A0A840IYE1_9PSEU|nr:UDP:flavonoid glycosyltransferase YjiC (YdhE family) [Amycolatopsis jiangsuensis]